MPELTSAALAKLIDHTLLKSDARAEDIRRVCDEARQHGFATVCVNGCWVPLAAECLTDCPTRPIAVVGFPLGAATSMSKAFEASDAARHGAAEIDMVLNLGAFRSGDADEAEADIRAVVEAVSPLPVKVILETCLLTNDEIVAACKLAQQAGAAFVKTSTGFSTGGATVEAVRLMRQTVGPAMGVKASGGVRSREDALRMVEAGASRLGTSASVSIVTGGVKPQGNY